MQSKNQSHYTYLYTETSTEFKSKGEIQLLTYFQDVNSRDTIDEFPLNLLEPLFKPDQKIPYSTHYYSDFKKKQF